MSFEYNPDRFSDEVVLVNRRFLEANAFQELSKFKTTCRIEQRQYMLPHTRSHIGFLCTTKSAISETTTQVPMNQTHEVSGTSKRAISQPTPTLGAAEMAALTEILRFRRNLAHHSSLRLSLSIQAV